MRIHIFGEPGSGKTTLARRLASVLNIPFYETDVIGWEGGNGVERSLEARLADINQIAAQPGWVTEGGDIGWTEPLYQAADYIIWLDLPWRITGRRIVMRHFHTSLAGTNRHPGLLKLWRFYCGVRGRYYGKGVEAERNKQLHNWQPYMTKFIHCRHPVDVEAAYKRILAEASH